MVRLLWEGISDTLVRGSRGNYHVLCESIEAQSRRKRACVAESEYAGVMIDKWKQTQYIESMCRLIDNPVVYDCVEGERLAEWDKARKRS